MKLLVISDSHGGASNIRAAMENHKDAEAVVFLGDGLRDLERCTEFTTAPIVKIRGNCDGFFGSEDAVEQAVLNLGGINILCCHGHRYGVKSALGALAYAALEKGASLALYGHTHVPLETNFDGVKLFCPGSVREGSYGIVYIENGAILCSHGKI